MKKACMVIAVLAVFAVFAGGCTRTATADTRNNQKQMADSNKDSAKATANMPVVTKKP